MQQDSEQPNEQILNEDTYIYVIRVDMNDGTAIHPVLISEAEPDSQQMLDEAVEYFTELYRNRGIVSIDYAEDIYFAGVTDTKNIVDWKTFRSRIPNLR